MSLSLSRKNGSSTKRNVRSDSTIVPTIARIARSSIVNRERCAVTKKNIG